MSHDTVVDTGARYTEYLVLPVQVSANRTTQETVTVREADSTRNALHKSAQ